MVIKELLLTTISKLKDSGNDNPVFEAHLLVRSVLNLSATDLVISHYSEVSSECADKIATLTARRIKGEPLQYILGVQEFMSLEFLVTPDVLIPRADTETLVEYVLEKYRNIGFLMLDIGTGTGCIPLSIAHYNSRAFAHGLDISKEALCIADKNCVRLGLTERVRFENVDIMNSIPCGKYDLVTSNPPYIKHDIIQSLQTEVTDFEPHTALDGGKDGLDFYRRIISIAPQFLNRGGMLVFEIGYDQAKEVSALMEKDFRNITVIKDLCGNDRVVSANLKA